MTPFTWLLWALSLAALLAFFVRDLGMTLARRRETWFSLWLVLVMATLVVTLVFSPSHERMTDDQRPAWGLVGLLYLMVVVGMLAQHFYFRKEGKPLKWSALVRPFLASPIVFLPLLSGFQKALSHVVAFGLPELMMFLAAFQNGFFWKVVFDRQREGLEGND